MTFVRMNEKFFPRPMPVIPPTRRLKAPIMPPTSVKALVTQVEDIEAALAEEPEQEPSLPPMAAIAHEVAKKHGITVNELMAHRRNKKYAYARFEFCWRAHHETRHSYPRIGKFLGGRDHTTIMYAVTRHQERLDSGEATL